MSRYLTPAKIGLLALIELYVESAVPTASTIAVLSFIISHIVPSSAANNRAHVSTEGNHDSGNSLTISIRDFEKLLSPHRSASGLPGRSLWDLFLKKLWEIDSLDALHIFFERRSDLVAKSRELLQQEAEAGIEAPNGSQILLSRTSPCGSFVRRAQLEFTRLRFHDALSLWKSFIAYRKETFHFWRKRHNNAGTWSFDAALNDIDEECGHDATQSLASITYRDSLAASEDETNYVSTDDIERVLEFQVEQMQSMLDTSSLKTEWVADWHRIRQSGPRSHS